MQIIAQFANVFVNKGCLPASFLVKEEGKQTSWICFRGSLPRLVFSRKKEVKLPVFFMGLFSPLRFCFRKKVSKLPEFVVEVHFPASFLARKKEVKLPTFFTGLFSPPRFLAKEKEGKLLMFLNKTWLTLDLTQAG